MALQQVRRARTEAAILDAAERLLVGGDFTVEALAAEADVSVGTLYTRLGGKPGVLRALAERLVTRNEEYVAEAQAGAAGPADAVARLAASYEQFHLDQPVAFRLLGQVEDPDLTARLEAMLRTLARSLKAAMDAGDLMPADPLRTARIIWAASNGVLALHARGRISDKELRRSLTQTREVLLRGLRA